MLESINIHSSVAVYMQIENQVQFAIASGELKPDDRLPSIGALSKRLGINLNTVAKSYRDLEVRGLIYTRRGVGVFVEKGARAKCREECGKRIVDRLHEVVAEATAAGMSAAEIKKTCNASYSSDGVLYGEVPKAILALAKAKSGKK